MRIGVAGALVLLSGCSRGPEAAIDPQIAARIASTKAIDDHAHPVAGAGDKDFDALPVEMLDPQTDPVRLRPGKPGPAMTPIQVLDSAGIERMVANRVSMNATLPRERFLWVAYADVLMYPFPAGPLIHNPDQKEFFELEQKLLARYYKESSVTRRPATLDDYVNRVLLATVARHKQGGAIGEKFEMAYLRPLDIANPTRAEAERAWRSGARTEGQYRVVEDFLFHAIANECGRLGMAVHFHTGAGAGGYYNAAGGNPMLLSGVFNDPALRKTNFVMVHGGFPFTSEALALLQKPNVYLDFSVRQFVQAPSDLAQAIRSWLEFTPEKVMFGTDAYPYAPGLGWEETAIMASKAGKEALGIALTNMVREGTVTRERAEELAEMVLRGNARKLYGLK